MLYPLSYEGLVCPFAQLAGRILVRRGRVGCLAPDGLCHTCAAYRNQRLITSPYAASIVRGAAESRSGGRGELGPRRLGTAVSRFR